jgi:hypothetical protein
MRDMRFIRQSSQTCVGMIRFGMRIVVATPQDNTHVIIIIIGCVTAVIVAVVTFVGFDCSRTGG